MSKPPVSDPGDWDASGDLNGPSSPQPPRGPRKFRKFKRSKLTPEAREHRRRRLRRHGRRAYIRSVYSLPSLATLGNAVCGFAAMFVATLDAGSPDRITSYFFQHQFVAAAYLIFVAMLFDALDGRLARFTRHTTDFGGQLDSLADVISFGAAPAFLALQLFKSYFLEHHWSLPPVVTRLVWAIGALYVSCAAIRLARFNVSNEHGEQHHFSFLGLPSPGAGGTVAALVLMQQEFQHTAQAVLKSNPSAADVLSGFSTACIVLLPLVVLGTGLLMVSAIRYPHLVNRYLRGRRSVGQLLLVMALLLALVVAHRYTLGVGTLIYALSGLIGSTYLRFRPRPGPPDNPAVPVLTPAPAGPAGGMAIERTEPEHTEPA